MRSDSRLVRKERIAWRVIEGEAVILGIDQGEVHVLNPVATRIWELIDGQRTLGQIAEQIYREFEVDRPQAEADAQEFVETLISRGLVYEAVETGPPRAD